MRRLGDGASCWAGEVSGVRVLILGHSESSGKGMGAVGLTWPEVLEAGLAGIVAEDGRLASRPVETPLL